MINVTKPLSIEKLFNIGEFSVDDSTLNVTHEDKICFHPKQPEAEGYAQEDVWHLGQKADNYEGRSV